MEYCDDAEKAVAIVDSLPEINRLVLAYLIRFLQVSTRLLFFYHLSCHLRDRLLLGIPREING